MLLNADFTHPALVHAASLDWTPSPVAGVERRMLFRIGEEKAVATSLVRFAPGSSFAGHVHPGGESFLVVEGTFEDENGVYPAGSYVRNPVGSKHLPRSRHGCVIFVQLWQCHPDEHQQLALQPGESLPADEPQPAGRRLLFSNAHEKVFIQQWAADTSHELLNPDGMELLVLHGRCLVEERLLQSMSWVRLPAGHHFMLQSGPEGCEVWIRQGAPAPAVQQALAALED